MDRQTPQQRHNNMAAIRSKDTKPEMIVRKWSLVVSYKRVRRLSMRIVKNGDVHVTVPMGVPKQEVERFIEENVTWIAKARERTAKRLEQRAAFYGQLPLETPLQRAEALGRMKTLIPPIVARYAKEMGVQPKTISYSATISRWGVCYPKQGRVGFSVYLLLLPDWCVEHVVVHELAHLLEPSHNQHFYAIMDKHFPRWKEARKEMARC